MANDDLVKVTLKEAEDRRILGQAADRIMSDVLERPRTQWVDRALSDIEVLALAYRNAREDVDAFRRINALHARMVSDLQHQVARKDHET